jgi:hypothetical protein
MHRSARLLLVLSVLLLAFFFHPQANAANGNVRLYPVPAEVSSTHFVMTINGKRTPVQHAASGYYLLNFDVSGRAVIEIKADDPHYWDRGVEVQPMRYGIRPERHGAVIRFTIPGPAKLSISRPGEHFADDEMLFLFANEQDHSGIGPNTPGIRYYGPGVHHENIDAASGDTIYLAGGAVVFGALNIWQVSNVHVLGRGSIIYEGAQNPNNDDGWMHKKNWHCIVMDNAHNIEVDGITCIVRSRTWQIQMKDSRNIGFYNIKVIGGTKNDANQDGMDWLGGGDTTVRNSFFRASDDVFALQGNWDGYDLALMRQPGHDVTNITIENTVASTSISNTIRVAWPQKTFNSAHFHMSDMDVIHTGFGACKVPFAFFELWADPDGKGSHSDYTFHNIRLEDWYALFQIRQGLPKVRDVHFSNMWAMDGPGMVAPVLSGDVSGVTLQGASVQGYLGAKVDLENNAAAPQTSAASVNADFTYTAGALRPGQTIHLEATAPASAGRRFEWLLGDGSHADGRSVEHRYPDADGTLLDGSGRFRVLLHVVNGNGEQSWSSESVVVAKHPIAATASNMSPEAGAMGARVFSRMLDVPADGGYTFTLLTSTKASLTIDDLPAVLTPEARAQVCGAAGNAVQPARVSAVLLAGKHRIRVQRDDAIENADGASAAMPLLLWEGPGVERQPIPASALQP